MVVTREWLEDPIMKKIKRWCAKKGYNGIRELVASLRASAAKLSLPSSSASSSEDLATMNSLGLGQFDLVLQTFGIHLPESELSHLRNAFQTPKGEIDLSQFAANFYTSLPPRRRAVIQRVIRKLLDLSSSTSSNNAISLEVMLQSYSANAHPLVRKGEVTAEEDFNFFRGFFNDATNPTGVVREEEICTFYAGVSQNISDDEYFEQMMSHVWGIEDTIPLADTSFGSIYDAYEHSGGTHMKTTMASMSIGSSNANASPVLQACYATYGPNNRNYNMTYAQSKKGFLGNQPLVHPTAPAYLRTNYETTVQAAHRPFLSSNVQQLSAKLTSFKDSTAAQLQSSGLSPVEQVKVFVYQRSGQAGIRGLIRLLRVLDENGNGSLDKFEFQNGLHMFGLKFTLQQMEELMNYFDRDRNGQISIAEFQSSLRGPLNERRVGLVKQAYALLDVNGDGMVTLGELTKLFDVSKHPDVLNKERTAAQVLQEFVRDWDRNSDQRISEAEFLDYYADLSAGIDSDDYFELMVRNTWHISGGIGVCANTSCRRVLVVHSNGKQTVEEIKNDLRITAKDLDLMLQNLQAQGIRDVKQLMLAF